MIPCGATKRRPATGRTCRTHANRCFASSTASTCTSPAGERRLGLHGATVERHVVVAASAACSAAHSGSSSVIAVAATPGAPLQCHRQHITRASVYRIRTAGAPRARAPRARAARSRIIAMNELGRSQCDLRVWRFKGMAELRW
eukprot:COSAG02_NODE_1419_length_12701_cov_20.731551_2_plen_144_part_00